MPCLPTAVDFNEHLPTSQNWLNWVQMFLSKCFLLVQNETDMNLESIWINKLLFFRNPLCFSLFTDFVIPFWWTYPNHLCYGYYFQQTMFLQIFINSCLLWLDRLFSVWSVRADRWAKRSGCSENLCFCRSHQYPENSSESASICHEHHHAGKSQQTSIQSSQGFFKRVISSKWQKTHFLVSL